MRRSTEPGWRAALAARNPGFIDSYFGKAAPDVAEFIIGLAEGRTRWLHPGYDSFHGMTLRSISWNSTAVMRPRMPITTMPTNM